MAPMVMFPTKTRAVAIFPPLLGLYSPSLGSGNLSFSSANDIVVAANGDLFVTGTICNSCYPNNFWIIRRSSDNGSTWTTVNSQLGTVWTQAESFTATHGRLSLGGGGGLAARNGVIVYTGTDSLNFYTASPCNGTGMQTGFTAGRQ